MKTDEERLYDDIMQNREVRGIELSDLGEDMAVGKQVIGRYWKPRFLIDHRNRSAVEFMSLNERLRTVKSDDILWETLSDEEEINAMFRHLRRPEFDEKIGEMRHEAQSKISVS